MEPRNSAPANWVNPLIKKKYFRPIKTVKSICFNSLILLLNIFGHFPIFGVHEFDLNVLVLGLNGTNQPPASNGIQAALLQQPQKQPQLGSFKQRQAVLAGNSNSAAAIRNPSRNRLLEAAVRHPRIVEV